MRTLQRLLDYNSLHWVSWLIAYRICVTFQLPIWASVILYLFLLSAGIWAYRRWFNQDSQENTPPWFVPVILLMGAVIGITTLFFSRPDGDDTSYIGIVRLETESLNNQFSVYEFRLAGLDEQPEEAYRAFPYEAFVATTSNLVGIEPVQSYHNLAMIFISTWWVIVYAMLFRAMGLAHRYILVAILLAILFLFIDGNLHRTHGNFSFMRLWQGKVIMIAILLPQVLLGSLRFFQTPNPLNWLRLCAASLIAAEFSRSGIFLIPPILAACVVAGMWSGLSRWRTGIMMLLAGWFPVALGLWIVLTGVLPSLLSNNTEPKNRNSTQEMPPMEAEWRDLMQEIRLEIREQQVNLVQSPQDFSPNWYENIYSSGIGSNIILLRDAVLLLLPILLIRQREGKFLTIYNLMIILLVATPITGPIVINLIGNTGYWRVLFLLSLPLCFGLLVNLTQWSVFNRQGLIRWLVAVVAVGLCLGGFRRSILDPFNGVEPKAPWELRVAAGDRAVVDETEIILKGQSVVAVQPLSFTISLTTIENMSALAYPRVMDNSNKWHYVDEMLQCRPDPRVTEEMIRYVLDEFGATYIFMRDCGTLEAVNAINSRYLPGWERLSQYGRYWLLERRAG